MLHSSKAREIATITRIEGMIRDAAMKGEFIISLEKLSKDAKKILLDNGYHITTLTGVHDGETKTRYDISWDA